MKKLLSIILVITLTMTLFTSCGATEKAFASTYLNLGEKYLTDLNYEQALVCFNKAIEVEPKNERAYLGAAEAYAALGDIDSAIAILEQGIEAVDDPTELQAKLRELLGENDVQGDTDNAVPEQVTVAEETEEPVFVTTAEYFYNSDGSMNWGREYEYDLNGNEIMFTGYYSDGSIDSYESEYEYDSNGNVVSYKEYFSDGSVLDWIEYEYDSSGNKIKQINYDSDGSVSTWYECEYGIRGNLTKRIYYGSDGNVSSWDEYEYDSNGNQVKDTYYKSDGSVSSVREYEYDVNRNQIKQVNYDSNGSISYFIENEYDSSGNLTRSAYNYNGSECWYEYEYDSYGKVSKSTKYDSNGDATWWGEYNYEYDSNGNVVRYKIDASSAAEPTMTFVAGILMEVVTFHRGDDIYYEYTYDSNGKIVSKTITTYEDGVLYSIEYQTRIN
ncbi:MAG: tetratricopeptide repeat protein [Oscillospiraceae bacterium]|nr:tetratricopeptide repeat protein [Oscillospiraceae bacterium]